jgi:hypothetical protein
MKKLKRYPVNNRKPVVMRFSTKEAANKAAAGANPRAFESKSVDLGQDGQWVVTLTPKIR